MKFVKQKEVEKNYPPAIKALETLKEGDLVHVCAKLESGDEQLWARVVGKEEESKTFSCLVTDSKSVDSGTNINVHLSEICGFRLGFERKGEKDVE